MNTGIKNSERPFTISGIIQFYGRDSSGKRFKWRSLEVQRGTDGYVPQSDMHVSSLHELFPAQVVTQTDFLMGEHL